MYPPPPHGPLIDMVWYKQNYDMERGFSRHPIDESGDKGKLGRQEAMSSGRKQELSGN